MKFPSNKVISVSNFLVFSVAVILFVIPFFWIGPGFVDLGGDNGRLYFMQPLSFIQSVLNIPDHTIHYLLATVPYVFFLSLLKIFIHSPTDLISFEHGTQLSLGFLFIYLISKELIHTWYRGAKNITVQWVGMVSGIVYIGFVSVLGWPVSLYTQNQVFINPLLFFLLLRFMLTHNVLYGLAMLAVTAMYSASFGFGSTPPLFSFFPLTCLFLILYIRFFLHKRIPWRGLVLIGSCFIGLHAFHLLPLAASLLVRGGAIGNLFFSGDVIGNQGVHYFDFNHLDYGKISLQLFQPAQWHGQNALAVLIPFIAILGFLKKPSKLLWLLGVFFAATLFLLAANITSGGVQLYRMLFYIPGFMMFRSFYEKWYFVFAFFYALLFAVSFYQIVAKKRIVVAFLVGLCVIGSIGYRIYPFLKGQTVNAILWQSNNVSSTFMMDPDLVDTIGYVKTMPDDGNVLTLPLTLPFYQIAYGKEGGAYVGISMVQFLGGKKDFSGLASFGLYKNDMFELLRKEDVPGLLQILSLQNIRYVFRNTDERIMEDFPGFPYVYPGELYYAKDVIPSIKNQAAYEKLLSLMPLQERFKKGFYHIYELDKASVRPTVYVPDVLYASQSGAVSGPSYRSAFGDDMACKALQSFDLPCNGTLLDGNLPNISFTKASKTEYDVTINLKERTKPFVVVLSEEYHPSWEMKLNGKKEGVTHISMNGYANAWIIDSEKISGDGAVHGVIQLEFQKYYTYGWIISGLTGGLLIIYGISMIIKKRYGKN